MDSLQGAPAVWISLLICFHKKKHMGKRLMGAQLYLAVYLGKRSLLQRGRFQRMPFAFITRKYGIGQGTMASRVDTRPNIPINRRDIRAQTHIKLGCAIAHAEACIPI